MKTILFIIFIVTMYAITDVCGTESQELDIIQTQWSHTPYERCLGAYNGTQAVSQCTYLK